MGRQIEASAVPQSTADGTNGERQLCREVIRLASVVDERPIISTSPSLLRVLGAALAVVVPLAAGATWVLDQRVEASEQRVRLELAERVNDVVRTEVLGSGLATAAQQARQEQHMADIDRRLGDLDRKLEELLKRGRGR